MGQLLLSDNIPNLVKASSSSLTLASTNNGLPSRITIGGQQYKLSSTLTLSTAGTGANGLDTGALGAIQLWYVYAIVNQTSFAVALVASQTSPSTGPTMPSGYGTAYKLVGAFYTDGSSTVGSVVSGALGGVVSTDWMSFTLSFSGSPPSFSVNSAFWRRVGNVVQIHWRVVTSSTGSGSITPNAITNLSVDTTQMPTYASANGTSIGTMQDNTGTPLIISLGSGGSASTFIIDNFAASYLWTALGTGGQLGGSYYYPVSGWKSSLL